jgi:hypothetical protein
MSEDVGKPGTVVLLDRYRKVPAQAIPMPAPAPPTSAYIGALSCFCMALSTMATRRQIARELLEDIFDRAEELSIDGEEPTPATRLIRELWDEIEWGCET